jgi:DNA-binding NarL/FixJ family response regulator
MTTVLIVDDDSLARLGLRAALEGADDLTVVGEAPDGAEAVRQARDLRPDVVIMDVQMPRLDGVSATREIRRLPDPPTVLVVTAFNLTRSVIDAIDAGAGGFLLKDSSRTQIVAAIHSAVAGEPVLDPRSVRHLLDHLEAERRDREEAQARLTGLSPRETEVLAFLADGRPNAEIARRLFLSEATVKSVVSHILDRIGVENRTQAAILAHRAGLDDGPDQSHDPA